MVDCTLPRPESAVEGQLVSHPGNYTTHLSVSTLSLSGSHLQKPQCFVEGPAHSEPACSKLSLSDCKTQILVLSLCPLTVAVHPSPQVALFRVIFALSLSSPLGSATPQVCLSSGPLLYPYCHCLPTGLFPWPPDSSLYLRPLLFTSCPLPVLCF